MKTINRINKIIDGSGKEISGKEKENVLNRIKEQEDSAAQGFGTLFG